MSWNDFNTAEKANEFDLIPANTLVKVLLKIRPGGHNDPEQGWTGGLATRNDASGAVYLNGEFTVMGGKYNKRKVFSLIGLHSPKGPNWANMGKTFIRAALESARGIDPDDMSDAAQSKRRISGLDDLNGLEFVVKVAVQKGEGGYEDKNVINFVIPKTHKEHAGLMAGSGTTETASASATQAGAQTSSGALPSWATA